MAYYPSVQQFFYYFFTSEENILVISFGHKRNKYNKSRKVKITPFLKIQRTQDNNLEESTKTKILKPKMEKKLIFNQKSNIHREMNVNIWTGFQKM